MAPTKPLTPLLAPLPRACHWLPSQRAMPLALTVPAVANPPPTYALLPPIANAETLPSRPLLTVLPSECHWLPSQRAALKGGVSAAVLKKPAACALLLLLTAIAFT